MNKLTKQTILVVAAVVVTIALLLASCGQKPAPSGTQPAAPASTMKPIKLRYTGGLPPTHHMTVEQKWFAAEIAKRSNGLVTVDTYVGGELYDNARTIDAVSTGAIEMGFTTGGMFSSRNPVHGFYNYFFMLAGTDHYEKVKDKLTTILGPLYEELNVKLIHWFAYGDTGYAGNKPLVKPDDIKGVMIRGMNPETLASLKALGAVPASITESEVYDALSKKAIDGTLTGWSTMYSRKLYEVAKYFTGSWFASPWPFFINMDVWKQLPPDVQKLIMDVAKEVEVMTFKQSRDYDKESLDVLRKSGTLTILSPEQRTEWVKFVRPTYDEWLAKCDKTGYGKQARELMKMLDETR